MKKAELRWWWEDCLQEDFKSKIHRTLCLNVEMRERELPETMLNNLKTTMNALRTEVISCLCILSHTEPGTSGVLSKPL